MTQSTQTDSRVAVLVDCDNTSPEVLEHALKVVAQFGRVVLRRGYGNHATLANKWQEALVRLAFTPCLQYQYASGKNTADIALALDAIEALLIRPLASLVGFAIGAQHQQPVFVLAERDFVLDMHQLLGSLDGGARFFAL